MGISKKSIATILILGVILNFSILSNAYVVLDRLSTNFKTMYQHESLPSLYFGSVDVSHLTLAMNQWSAPKSGANFRFTNGGNTYGPISGYDYCPEVGKAYLQYVPGLPSYVWDSIAVTFRPGDWEYPDAYFNSKYSFTGGGNVNAYSYAGIGTHELGHVLGLGDMPWYSTSTMSGYWTPLGSYDAYTLEQDDKNGVRYLYPY